MLGHETVAVGQEGEEAASIVLHRAGPLQGLELTKGVGPDRCPKAQVDELDEAWPGHEV